MPQIGNAMKQILSNISRKSSDLGFSYLKKINKALVKVVTIHVCPKNIERSPNTSASN